ncbi:MAG TPA: YggS family pyridoxal phosphate-dependent enzyme [Gemmatimonadales bacterium]|nr:YggS family pyridoxal phosphate-dependent enzyme [Gemmatimonadales bacterium]
MLFPALADNLARVREEIARVQAVEGLRGAVRIVAVTKGHPPEAVREAVALGLGDIGENRVQEGLDKQAQVSDAAVMWHLIGHLQTNKAKFVPGHFGYVHSLDSVHVAEALARAVRRRAPGEAPRVLLQVNVAGESHKSGCRPEAAPEIAARVAAMPELQLVGLMTMAPFTDDITVQRRTFARLRELRDRLGASGLVLPELSMGMSGDYRAAVAEGATMLRLGTVLFGERPQ